jgi:putative ABC transport system permease protein
VGVVSDFHFESFYKKVGPAFLEYNEDNPDNLVRIKGGAETEILARLSVTYKQFNPGVPFAYRFLEDDYQAMYASEQKVSILFRYFAAIAVIISCLGLFGLAPFTAQQRQKEIDIRKVVGATITDITLMLSKDFPRLISVAIAVAFPVAAFLMDHWLSRFAYRVPVGTGVFVVAGGAILLVTASTISFQAIKAALVNPVRSLRSD